MTLRRTPCEGPSARSALPQREVGSERLLEILAARVQRLEPALKDFRMPSVARRSCTTRASAS